MSLRVIGDVHGKYKDYLKLINKSNAKGLHTLQLGDLGFDFTYERLLDSIDTELNKFFMGNHDNYNSRFADDEIFKQWCLGDFGEVIIGGVKLFFVRGAFSIDKKYRTPGIDWFPDEEISESRFQEVLDAYLLSKPNVVVSHECPNDIGKEPVKNSSGEIIDVPLKKDYVLKTFGFDPMTFNTKTGFLLQQLWDAHQPDKWVFGHYHPEPTWISKIGKTDFICLGELVTFDL